MRVILFVSFLLLPLVLATGSRANEYAKVIDTIAYEASGEEMRGQIEVAHVILNRACTWRKTAYGVVMMPNQFSCWLAGKPTQTRVLNDKDRFQAAAAYRAAKNRQRDKVMYYKVVGHKSPWFDRAVKAGRIKYAHTIGKHEFYEEV